MLATRAKTVCDYKLVGLSVLIRLSVVVFIGIEGRFDVSCFDDNESLQTEIIIVKTDDLEIYAILFSR